MKTRLHLWLVAAMPALVMLAFSCTASAQNFKIFLKLDGVEGESTSAAHRGEIEVLACSFDAGSDIEDLLFTSSPRPGITPLRIAKHLDKASPLLFLASLEETVFEEATVSFRKASAPFAFLVIKLQDVSVSNYRLEGTVKDRPSETIALSYGDIEVSYTASDARGRPAGTVTKKFTLQPQGS
jgi:type VI secretion system Hcp family effector